MIFNNSASFISKPGAGRQHSGGIDETLFTGGGGWGGKNWVKKQAGKSGSCLALGRLRSKKANLVCRMGLGLIKEK